MSPLFVQARHPDGKLDLWIMALVRFFELDVKE